MPLGSWFEYLADLQGSANRPVYCRQANARIRREATYHAHAMVRRNPDLASKRAKRDTALRPEIQRVWEDNLKVYGVRKVWHQLRREGFDVARCTVARLMKQLGLQGVIRGKGAKTTVSDKSEPCPEDKVKRQFRAPAPNRLCPLSDASIACRVRG